MKPLMLSCGPVSVELKPFVCVCVCVYICTCVCMCECVCMYVCAYVCVLEERVTDSGVI